jgi:short-subunit dehydrogenase
MDWSNGTVLITGASSGIGAATARLLASHGLRVILVARREEKLLDVQNEITLAGGEAKVIQADLSVELERECVYKEVLENYGSPDILINNAGFGWYGYFSDMPLEVCKSMIDVDILATVHLTRLFLPEMLKKNQARIINIGSIAGGLPEQGVVIYSACKAFLDAFSTSLYRELTGTPTKVSILRCGPVKTEFFDQARSLPNGHSVPAESMAIPAEDVAKGVWKLIHHPRRVLYLPFYYVFSPLIEILFSKIIDRVGPLLLRKNVKKYPHK